MSAVPEIARPDGIPETVDRETLERIALCAYLTGVREAEKTVEIDAGRACVFWATFFSMISAALSLAMTLRILTRGAL